MMTEKLMRDDMLHVRMQHEAEDKESRTMRPKRNEPTDVPTAKGYCKKCGERLNQTQNICGLCADDYANGT